MPIELGEWESIHQLVEDYFRKRGNEVTQGIVLKRDEALRQVFVKEFGDEPIPVVGLSGQLYVFRKNARELLELPVVVPKVGELVLILKVAAKAYCIGKIDMERPTIAPPLLHVNDEAAPPGGGA